MTGRTVPGEDARPYIAVFTRSFFPSAVGAGPSRSLAALVDCLTDEFRFQLVTTDRHTRRERPLEGIESNVWTSAPETSAPVRYCSPDEWKIRGWCRLLRSIAPDLYYFNSMFAFMTVRTLLLRRLRLIPRAAMIIAPRGEFAPDALGLKGARKRLYLKVVALLQLLDGVMLQGSTERERDDIVAALPKHRRQVVVAMDMTRLPAHVVRTSGAVKIPGELRLVLVGRVAPMKNIDYAIEALRTLQGQVALDVIGPFEDAQYLDECRSVARTLPPNVAVRFVGEVAPEAVATMLPAYDAFFLPSRGENYCHAIVEALAAGVPVLISDRTPWSGVREKRAGWVFSLDGFGGIRQCLAAAAAMDEMTFSPWRDNARAFGVAIAASDRAENENRTMFRQALGRQPSGANEGEQAPNE